MKYHADPILGEAFCISLVIFFHSPADPGLSVLYCIYPLQTSTHRLNKCTVKANQVLLLGIKKVYFKSRGIGVVTVYLVWSN